MSNCVYQSILETASFDQMMIVSVLYQINTIGYSSSSLIQQSAVKHAAPLGHVILNPCRCQLTESTISRQTCLSTRIRYLDLQPTNFWGIQFLFYFYPITVWTQRRNNKHQIYSFWFDYRGLNSRSITLEASTLIIAPQGDSMSLRVALLHCILFILVNDQ